MIIYWNDIDVYIRMEKKKVTNKSKMKPDRYRGTSSVKKRQFLGHKIWPQQGLEDRKKE